jgi:uncharacterized delta-60 repeat protein
VDHTFGGGDGVVAVNVRDTDRLEAIAVQPDGKIVAVGWSLPTGFAEDVVLTVVRFRADGALDRGFAGDGSKTVWFGDGTDAYGRAIALFDDGRIALAGGLQRDYGSRSEMFTVVLKKDGSLDPNFGKRRFDLGKKWAQADEIQITGSGKLLVIGSAGPWYVKDKDDLAVARLSPSGLDTTYGGGDGYALVDLRNDDRAVGSAQLSKGRLLVLARALVSTERDVMGFVRLRGDGRRDRDWGGGDGVVTHNLFRTEYVWDVAVADDGKMVVVGWENEHPLVMRFKRDGSLDRSFGGDGIVDTSTPISDYDLTGVILQPDGRIVACGSHRVTPTRDGIGAERLIP